MLEAAFARQVPSNHENPLYSELVRGQKVRERDCDVFFQLPIWIASKLVRAGKLQDWYDKGIAYCLPHLCQCVVIKMPDPLVKVKVHQSVGTISLHRDEKRNSLTRSMISDLQQAFRDLHGEKRVRAVILTASGRAFCAGLCLAEMHEIMKEDDSQERWHQDTRQLAELLVYMLRFPKPIIAAVNGPALGFGAGLILASDIALASSDASFGFPEPRRGIISGLCTPLLHFRVGGRHAARLLLSTETISAARGVEIGAYDEIVKSDLLWARGVEITKQIEGAAAEAIQLSKRTLNETVGEQLEMMISLGAAASATSRTTEAAQEGVAAFVDKREPEWP